MIKNLHIKPLNNIIAASIAWKSYPVDIDFDIVPIDTTPLKLAGTGQRMPTTLTTRSSDEYYAADFAMGGTDHEVGEIHLCFPAFAATTGGEVAATSTMTIEGIATRASNGQRTLGQMNDATDPITLNPNTGDKFVWVKFTPAAPLPAGEVWRFSVSMQLGAGDYPTRRVRGVAVSSVWGGTLPDERGQSSATSLLSTLSGSTNYSNAGGSAPVPFLAMVETPQTKRVVFAIGDSKAYGADMTIRNKFLTERLAHGFVEMGLDENVFSQRVQHGSLFAPGWGFLSTSTSASHGNASASANQLAAIEAAVAINGGRAIADILMCQHLTNSSTAGVANIETGYRALYPLWSTALGNPDMHVCQIQGDAYPSSTNGYNDFAGQSPTNTHQDYPSGGRWQSHLLYANDDGSFDPSSPFATEGLVDSTIPIWRNASFDTGSNRDAFKVRPTGGGLAVDYSGTGDVILDWEPEPTDYLSFYDGTNEDYHHIDSITDNGDGTWTVDTLGNPSAMTAAQALAKPVYSPDLHPGARYHGELAYDTSNGIAGWKIANGFDLPLAAPQMTSSSITGTPQDGETLTANATATGNPIPTFVYQWRRNGVDISGETASTHTLDAAGDGWVDGDTISVNIRAVNSEGFDEEQPSDLFEVPVAGPTPSRVASTQGDGNGSGAPGDTTLAATGSNRRVIAFCSAGTSDGVTDISMTLQGATSSIFMTRIVFQGSQNNNDPAQSLEAFAVFEADEADLVTAGAGPYTVNATAAGSNVPDKVGFVIASYQDSPSAAVSVVSDSLANSISVTPSTADSRIIGFGGTSSSSGSLDFTAGVTRFEINSGYGDAVAMGDGVASGATTITHDGGTRQVVAALSLGTS